MHPESFFNLEGIYGLNPSAKFALGTYSYAGRRVFHQWIVDVVGIHGRTEISLVGVLKGEYSIVHLYRIL